MNNRLIKYCLFILIVFSSLGIFSQEFKNEEDRKKHANKLFDKGKYVEATPHILHFLSLNQTSPEYNFKYGVCLMYADEDKEKSLRYLKFAASKGGGGDSRVFFFLGKSYHLNYNFKEALKYYQKFKAEGEPNYKKDLQVDLHIQMCSNGKKLLQNLTELVVYEKTESSFQRFQYSYDLSEIGGKILVSSEFQSKYDKKIGYQSVVYFPPLNQDVLFYSSYGKDGSTGLDLYIVRRKASGGWGEPEKLPESINTPYDDAYGFLHADGKTFYFSSKGHNSMGGYDVFKVDYDTQINQFGTPKNLDYKINTPDDDIMYIVDPNFENAYFSSSRAAKGGYLDVYKVKVETFPIVNVILAGSFENKINAEDNAATIKVENMQSGEIEGIYNPDNAGNYIIVLPRSGKYKFIVETPESEKIHTGVVEIPSQKVVKPLKQSLALVKDGGVEKLVINNMFDQEVPNAAEIMAKVLKGMADPDPNADDFPDSLYNNFENENEIVTEALNENYTVDDLVALSSDKASEVQEEANELKKRMEAAYTVANNKSNQAKELTKQADDLLKEVETISNPLEKQEKLELAKKTHAQSKDLNMLATTALNLANSLKKEYDKKQAEATDAKNVAVAIEKAVNENSHDKAIAALKQLQTRIDSLIKDKPDYKSGFDEIVQKAKLKQEEADKANREAQEYREADDELNLRLSSLNREYEKAKKKDQPSIQRQIDDIKEQLQLNDELAKESFEKSKRLQEEADVLNHQVDLMSNLYDDIDAGTTVELTEEEKEQIKEYLASNELENSISQNENNLSQHQGTELANNTSENNSSTNNENSNTSSENETTESSEEAELTEEEKEVLVAEKEEEFSSFENQLQNLSEEASQDVEQKKDILENWIATIETKIQETETQIASTTEAKERSKLEYYLEWLQKQKELKTSELEELEELIAEASSAENSTSEENSTTQSENSTQVNLSESEVATLKEEINENYSSYESDLNAINSDGTEKEVATAKKKITEDWIAALDDEIMDVEDQLALASTPKEKAEAAEKLKLLNEQKSDKEVELNFIEEELVAIGEEGGQTEEVASLTQTEKDEIINEERKKFETFENRVEAVKNNSASRKEEVEQRIRLSDEWITYIDGEINTTENQYQETQEEKTKETLATKIDWLKTQKDEKMTEKSALESELATIEENESSVVINETQINEENQKAEDWLNIIDNDINELEQKIIAENDPQKKADLIAQKEKLENLKAEKQNIVETNTSIIEKSAAQKEVESSEEYQELVDEIENTSSIATDFEGSFTSSSEYESENANVVKEEISAQVDELTVIEQEIEDLEQQLAETKKEKKKTAIQNQIDNKKEKQYQLESDLGERIYEMDNAEYEANEKTLATLLKSAREKDNNYIKDENYQLAKLLEEKFIAQNEQAEKLIKEASFTENEAAKAEKLKDAHALQLAAIDNQKEAIYLIEETAEEDYTPTYIGVKEELLVENETTENTSNTQNELLTSSYVENQKRDFDNFEEEYSTIPNDEKAAYLVGWKSKVDTEVNKNMKLLTSNIPDEEKEIVSKNLELLRAEQQNIRSKEEDLNTLADNASNSTNETIDPDNSNTTNNSNNQEESSNNTSNENTVNEENSNANSEENTASSNENTSEESNNNVENTSNQNELATNNETNTNSEENTQEENTTTQNENTTSESTVASLNEQKAIFENYTNELDIAETNEEKQVVYNNWIAKLEDEIEFNEAAIKGNITIEEEGIIEEKIDWLEEQLEEQNDQLSEVKNAILEENPALAAVQADNKTVSSQEKQASKLNEKVEGIEFYSGKESLDVYEVSTNTEPKDLTENVEFTSTSANEIIAKNEATVSKVKAYNTTIETLETQKSEASDDKAITSIDKKISKAQTKKSKTALKLADDLKEASEKDQQLASEELEEAKALLTDEVDENSYAYKQAIEYEEKSEQLANEANQLRNEAVGIKDVVEKNEKLNEALAKEKTSIDYKVKASKLYTEAVVNSYNIDENTIAAVSENEEERPSTEIIAAANKADNLAYEYSTRAGELRDSAETVKKKYKAKVIQEAEVYTQRAKVQEEIAQKLNEEGASVAAKEQEVLENELLLTNLSQSDVEKVRTADNYDEIYAKQLAIEQFLKELRAEEELMRSYMNLAKQQENKARKYEEKAKNAESEDEKQKYLAIADKLYEQAEINNEKQDSIADIIDEINNKKEVVEQEQFDLLSLFDEEFQNDIRGLMLSNYEKTPLEKVEEKPALALNNLTSSNFEAPEDLTTNIVVINNNRQTSVYSESNPIPLNPKNPKGLVYKVQVGAFRKPIPQDLFKGFAPISAERIRDDITRYRVGYFVNFETANVSKNQIRGLGYNDAFVVAILNGKRISIAEARAYANNTTTEVLAVNETSQNTVTNSQEESETPSNTVTENNTNEENTNSSEEENTTVVEEEVPEYVRNLGEDAAEVNAVENIQGLFYTVQVGAFSKPIAKTGTFNISPLVTKYVNGLYKYTTGIYKSVQDADGRKNDVRAKGIPDAFVIAYYNGERVSLAQAQQIVQEKGEAAFTNKVEGGVSNNNQSQGEAPINNSEESNSDNNLNDNTPINRDASNSNTEVESTPQPETTNNEESITNNNPFENTVVEDDNNETNSENRVDNVESNEGTGLFAKSYLEDKRREYQEIGNNYTAIPASEKKEYVTNWKSKVDADINENMKLLISDIPNSQKDVISKNLELLRSEQQKVRNELEEINASSSTDGNSNTVEVNEAVEEDNSTYYVDLGVYYGTVPTPIAQALLTNKKAKIKRNKINDAATQYYCGVFLTKDEVAEIWASFVEDGLTDAKIVEIEEGEEFILMEKEDQIDKEIEENSENSISTIDTKLVYRVELGTFKETMPISTGKVFLELGYLGIEKKNYNNKQTYYCGKVDTEAEANELKQKFVDKGISEAKVVAFVGDRQISLIEAQELAK